MIVYDSPDIYNRKPIAIEGGIATLEVDEKSPFISMEAAPEFKLLSVTDGAGTALTPENIEVTGGMTINVTTAAIERELKANLFMSGLFRTTEDYYLKGARGHEFELAEGYSEIEFAQEDLPTELYLRGAQEESNTVLVNGESHTGTFFGWRHSLELADGDMLMVFVDDTPASHAVTINSTSVKTITVLEHNFAEMESYAAFEMLHGTEFTIVPEEGAKLVVTKRIVDDTPEPDIEPESAAAEGDDEIEGEVVQADEAGNYHFVVLLPMEITVADDRTHGIPEVSTDGAATVIYNLQGIRVADDASRLPGGIYIINGRKVRL